MRRGRAGALAIAIVAAWVAVAVAQVGPDAGVPDDAGAAGDAGPPRIVIDGPTLLGIGKPQVSAAASPTELRLGDKITLFVEVIFDESVAVALPAGLDLAPAFDELKRSSVDERRSDGTRKRVYQIQLQVWELGEFDLPPVQVTYSIGGESSWVVTNRVPLRVVGTLLRAEDVGGAVFAQQGIIGVDGNLETHVGQARVEPLGEGRERRLLAVARPYAEAATHARSADRRRSRPALAPVQRGQPDGQHDAPARPSRRTRARDAERHGRHDGSL